MKQFETKLTGVVLAAAQGDRLRLHHWRRIRQLRTENEPAHSLSKLTISEVAPRFSDLNVLYHLYQFTAHKLEEWEQNSPARTRYFVSTLGRFNHLYFWLRYYTKFTESRNPHNIFMIVQLIINWSEHVSLAPLAQASNYDSCHRMYKITYNKSTVTFATNPPRKTKRLRKGLIKGSYGSDKSEQFN